MLMLVVSPALLGGAVAAADDGDGVDCDADVCVGDDYGCW